MSSKLDLEPMIRAIKKISKTPPSLFAGALIGEVKSENPLKIVVDNGIEISGSMIWVSPFCQEWKTERLKHKHTYNVEHSHTYEDTTEDGATTKNTSTELPTDRDTSEEIETFTFWEGLKTGDKVVLVRINDSQVYLALWKEKQFRMEE